LAEQEQSGKKRVANPQRQAFEEAMAAEKNKAISANYEPTPSNEWSQIRNWWANSTESEKQDMLFGMAKTGAKPKHIAEYYGIKEADLKPYQMQISMGRAYLRRKIEEHQVRWALGSNQPMAKFFVGKQFAGQVDNPQHEDVQSLDEGKSQGITIKVIGRDTEAEEAGTAPFEGIGTARGPAMVQ
jgi:hypothetical protein